MCEQLPVEILEIVILHVAGLDDLIALPPWHITTRTLHSLLFVCKATNGIAIEHLYRRCLYIDSPWRLRTLVRSYSSQTQTPIFGHSTDPTTLRRDASVSMFLQPFPDSTIDEPAIVSSISQLFEALSDTLRRLVIDMPLRSYYPDEPGAQDLRSELRNAFLSLTGIEEFVSVRDELFLAARPHSDDFAELPVWCRWNRLQRLALYNLDTEPYQAVEILRKSVNAMPKLRTIILTRPDCEEDTGPRFRAWNAVLHIGFVNTWRHLEPGYRQLLSESQTRDFGETATIHRSVRYWQTESYRPLPILDIICVDGQRPFIGTTDSRRHQVAPNLQRSPAADLTAFDLEDTFNDIEICQEWVRSNALKGSLWPELEPDWPRPLRMSESTAV